MADKIISTGITELDNLLQGLFPGDNIVWQIDNLGDYAFFAEKFARDTLSNKLHVSI